MKKQKFEITKHIRGNGSFYYTCTVETESLRKPKNILELLKYGSIGVPFFEKHHLHQSGAIYCSTISEINDRQDVLNGIDKYIEYRETIEGQKVVSTEIEIIYK